MGSCVENSRWLFSRYHYDADPFILRDPRSDAIGGAAIGRAEIACFLSSLHRTLSRCTYLCRKSLSVLTMIYRFPSPFILHPGTKALYSLSRHYGGVIHRFTIFYTGIHDEQRCLRIRGGHRWKACTTSCPLTTQPLHSAHFPEMSQTNPLTE